MIGVKNKPQRMTGRDR